MPTLLMRQTWVCQWPAILINGHDENYLSLNVYGVEGNGILNINKDNHLEGSGLGYGQAQASSTALAAGMLCPGLGYGQNVICRDVCITGVLSIDIPSAAAKV